MIKLTPGESLVIAPGTFPAGSQDAWGAALATLAPNAQIVPAAAAVTASLVIGRLTIVVNLTFSGRRFAFAHGEAPQDYDWHAEPKSKIGIDFPEFWLSFLSAFDLRLDA